MSNIIAHNIAPIGEYFTLNEVQIEKFSWMYDLYQDWNGKINVISRKDIDNLYINHVLHSLSIAKFLNPVDGTSFVDVGTGGGFPGIPLAILLPACRFHLVDRIRKKITVVESVAKELGLDNVTSQAGDMGECHLRFDFAVSRAAMDIANLVAAVRKNISRKTSRNGYPNGVIALKGGDLQAELASLRLPYIEENISQWFHEPYFDTKKLIYVPL